MIEDKELDIQKKKEQLRILEEKSKRVDFKVKAMKKYEDYLESVRENNPDEY